MRAGIVDAVRVLGSLQVGDAVTVVDGGRELTGLTVSRPMRRSDGAYGSVESSHVTVTYGPGRYAFEVRAESIAAGRQSIRKV